MMRFHDLLKDYPDAVIEVRYGKKKGQTLTTCGVTLTVTLDGVEHKRIELEDSKDMADFGAEIENSLVGAMKFHLGSISQRET